MTTKERVETVIIRKIVNHFRMDARDVATLYEQILRQATAVYRQTIQSQLSLYSCQKLVTGPDNQATLWLEAKAAKDSEGIAQTYQNQLENEVQRIYSKNHKSNRYAYMAQLDVWIARRNVHKSASISLNTMTAAREYAAQRFRSENNITGRMIFVGPPPVCKKCLRLKAKGAVSVAEAKRYGDSQHVSCPHRWEALIPKKIDCETAWTG